MSETSTDKSPPILSERESQCVTWLAVGLRTKDIAEKMGVTVKTVDKHIASAKTRLDANTREHMVVKAIQMNLIKP